jgi:hypothetical protein
MMIPKEVVIGNTPHQIRTKKSIVVGNKICHGSFDQETHTITIAKGNPLRGYVYDTHERANTFWHELTHAILHDMGENRLNNNEKFVSAFADRLHQAIKTARF